MLRADFYRAMTPAGGALLACVGACLFVGAFQPNEVRLAMLVLGLIAGFCGLMATAIFMRLRHFEPAPAAEQALVWPPVIAGILVGWLLMGVLPPDERTLWLVMLGVTALHFFPLYWSLGPAIVVLGGLGLAIALTGLGFGEFPLAAIVASDGAIKLVIGMMMFAGAFRRRPTATRVAPPSPDRSLIGL